MMNGKTTSPSFSEPTMLNSWSAAGMNMITGLLFR